MSPAARPARVGYLWSAPKAPAEVVIRAALVRPTFDRLLALARDHGIEGLEREWNALRAEGSIEAQRATVSVERILTHIKTGFQRAHAAT